MGRRGPLPTPTPILRMRGSWLVNQRKDEPEIEPAQPVCPPELVGDERRMFRRIARHLHKQRVVCREDGDAIMRYVRFAAEFNRLSTAVRIGGAVMLVKNRDGEVCDAKVAPAFKAMMNAALLINKHAEILGLGPAYRARIQKLKDTKERADGDEKAAFFKIPQAG